MDIINNPVSCPILHLPHCVFGDICSRVPISTLMQCRGLCRSFRSSLSHPDFLSKQLSTCVLLHAPGSPSVFYDEDEDEDGLWYPKWSGLYLIDVDAIAKNHITIKLPTIPSVPICNARIVGSCNGFLCVSDGSQYYIANPLIGESLPLPRLSAAVPCPCPCGFGCSLVSNLYKVVLIISASEILILSVGVDHAWRNLFIENSIPQEEKSRGVYLKWKLNWISGRSSENNGFISSFDMETECFQQISLPSTHLGKFFNLGVFKECLYVIGSPEKRTDMVVWRMMDYPIGNSWTQTFVIEGCTWSSPTVLLKVTKKKQILLMHDSQLKAYTPGWKGLAKVEVGEIKYLEEALEHSPNFVPIHILRRG